MLNKWLKSLASSLFVFLPIIEMLRNTKFKDIELFNVALIELVLIVLILTMVVALSCNAMAFAVEEDFLDERHSQVVTLSGESDIPKLETKDEPKEQKEDPEIEGGGFRAVQIQGRRGCF